MTQSNNKDDMFRALNELLVHCTHEMTVGVWDCVQFHAKDKLNDDAEYYVIVTKGKAREELMAYVQEHTGPAKLMTAE